jgi:photosystem II stability/assembly factor-like uncharacterized protein
MRVRGLLLILSLSLVGLLSGRVDGAAAAPTITSGWREQSVPRLDGRPPILYSVHAYDERTLWAAGSQGPANVALYAEILKSTDGGQTWTVQYAPRVCCEILQIAAESPLRVTALQARPSGAVLLTSLDGGATWTESYSASAAQPIWGLAATAAGYTWAVGASGRIVYRYPSDATLRDASFPTTSTLWATTAAPRSATGWAVGDNGIVLKTDDGGAGWRLQAQIINDTLTSVAAASTDVAWTVGTRGAIFKTVDGGDTWVRQYPENRVNFNGVAAGSTDTAFLLAGTDAGVVNITSTVDGGRTWTTQYQDSSISSSRLAGGITAAGRYEAWAAAGPQILHTGTAGLTSLSVRLPFILRNAPAS